ncbi:MAG: tautomerase family protein [Lachnospiraceae bacterium]|nr:tautomerase family protein [Lachnospiraceae bacterium]
MPLVKVNMIKGKDSAYKKTLLDCIHDGMVESLDIEDWDRFQRIIEFEKIDFEKPSFKTDDFMIIELTMFPGRTKEQKGKVIEKITGKINEKLSVAPEDVFIVIEEPPLDNWGMAGKQKSVD